MVTRFDTQINYRKLAKAYTYIMDGGAEFILTNDDSTFPSNGT